MLYTDRITHLNNCIIGNGYIGQALERFWKGKHQVTLTTRSKERMNDSVNYFLLDHNFKELLQNQQIVVICVAPHSREVEAYEETYLNTAKEISEVLQENTSVEQVIYLSSTSVYGDKQGAIITEEEPLNPLNPQSTLLAQTEEVLLGLKQKVCVFRLGEIYGPGREFNKRLTAKTPFPGDGSNFINIIHRDQIISAIDFAVEKSLNGIYNLVEDLHITRKQFYDTLCEREQLPKVAWSPSAKSLHGGNKRVSNKKLKEAGFKL